MPAPGRLPSHQPADSHLNGNASSLHAHSAAKLSLSGGTVPRETVPHHCAPAQRSMPLALRNAPITDGRLPSCQIASRHAHLATRGCHADKFWNHSECELCSTNHSVLRKVKMTAMTYRYTLCRPKKALA